MCNSYTPLYLYRVVVKVMDSFDMFKTFVGSTIKE